MLHPPTPCLVPARNGTGTRVEPLGGVLGGDHDSDHGLGDDLDRLPFGMGDHGPKGAAGGHEGQQVSGAGKYEGKQREVLTGDRLGPWLFLSAEGGEKKPREERGGRRERLRTRKSAS